MTPDQSSYIYHTGEFLYKNSYDYIYQLRQLSQNYSQCEKPFCIERGSETPITPLFLSQIFLFPLPQNQKNWVKNFLDNLEIRTAPTFNFVVL